jgi:hypothetical protein
MNEQVPVGYRAVVVLIFILPLLSLCATHSLRRGRLLLMNISRIPLLVLLIITVVLLALAITNYMRPPHL